MLIAQLFSQPTEIKFEHLSIEDGLSQNSISAIIQDSRGFMWFGTLDGLNRYDGYNFTIYKHSASDSNSISASTISALFEDRFGYLWIGTMSAGLNRLHLDTGRITRFNHDPQNPNSLCDNRIRALFEDRSGVLWIGTRDSGLCRLQISENVERSSAEFQHFKHEPHNPNSLSENHVRAILEDRHGHLWIGTRGGGLNRLDRQNGRFIRYKHDPQNSRSLSNDNVECLYSDLAGHLWIGTYGGGLNLLRLSGAPAASADFVHFKHNPTDPQSLSDHFVETIFEDRTGTLWVGTTNGGLNRMLPHPAGKFNQARFTHYKYRMSDPFSISHNNIEILYEDFSGILWVGTWGGGLSKINRKQKKFAHYKSDPENPNSLCNNSVRAFCEDAAGRLWIGTAGGGLDRVDRKSRAVLHLRMRTGNNDVRALVIDRAGFLWVGTYGGGLSRLNLSTVGQQPAFEHFRHDPANPNSLCDNFVWSILEDKTGKLWIGTNRGLSRFDPAAQRFQNFTSNANDSTSLSHEVVRALYQDSRGDIWVGTYQGLNKLIIPPESGSVKFKRYYHDPNDPNSISHNSVISIYEDASGSLWFGTLGGGLNKLGREFSNHLNQDLAREKFVRFSEPDGLPNALVHAIQGDEQGNLWLSTNRGLSRFNERLPRGSQFRNYDVSDGLQSNEFNAGASWKSPTGELFFGGINGFNSFFPEDVKDNPNIAPVVLTAFRVFNQEKKLRRRGKEYQPLKLSYRENFFAFEFAALDFTAPAKNQYAYKMDGFDLDWVYSGTRRFASYTNLDPGKYVFRVKGSNNDGIWNEEGVSVQIEIVPPFWQTWWFRILMAVSLAALVAFVFNHRLKKLRTEKLAQEMFAKRLIEIQEKERKRIASELHDSLGQDLLIIKNRLQQCLPLLPAQGQAAIELQELAEMARRSIDEVREISSNLHPHQLDRLGLRKAIAAMASKFIQNTQVKLFLEISDVDGVFSKEREINIYRIVQEGLNNIFKHAEATEVSIQLMRSGTALSILIKDNGKGFDLQRYLHQAGQLQGFGLSNMFERIKILKGQMKIESKPGEGTAIKIRIPI